VLSTLNFDVRKAEQSPSERGRVAEFLEERSTARVARLGELVDAREQQALIAEEQGRLVGVLTYLLDRDSCEVLTLHVVDRWRGIGFALLRDVEWVARDAECRTSAPRAERRADTARPCFGYIE